MSKRTGLAASLGLALSLASTASLAEGSGWYFGVTGGQAEADLSKAGGDFLAFTFFNAIDADEFLGSTLDDSDTSFSLFGGYRVSEYFAVEAGYVDFGTMEYRATGMVSPVGLPQTAVTFSADVEATGFTVAAIGSVPIGNAFDVHGRAGVLFADTELTLGGSMLGVTASESISDNSQDFFYGLGVGLQVGTNWSFSLDWQQFKDVGDDENIGEADVNRLSLGVIYRL